MTLSVVLKDMSDFQVMAYRRNKNLFATAVNAWKKKAKNGYSRMKIGQRKYTIFVTPLSALEQHYRLVTIWDNDKKWVVSAYVTLRPA